MNRLLLMILCCLPLMANAQWTLSDQFNNSYTLTSSAEVLLIAADMDSAKWVKEALADKPEGYLDERRVVFLADISGMPKIISRMFAMPKMRKYNYTVILDRDGQVTAQYQAEPGKLTWIYLSDGQPVSRQTLSSAEELVEALEAQ